MKHAQDEEDIRPISLQGMAFTCVVVGIGNTKGKLFTSDWMLPHGAFPFLQEMRQQLTIIVSMGCLCFLASSEDD